MTLIHYYTLLLLLVLTTFDLGGGVPPMDRSSTSLLTCVKLLVKSKTLIKVFSQDESLLLCTADCSVFPKSYFLKGNSKLMLNVEILF